jgi:hypothetical protein
VKPWKNVLKSFGSGIILLNQFTSKGLLHMHKVANITYILETESYIEQNKENMKPEVYQFIKQVCMDEKKYHDLVQQWAKEKTFFKLPEAKAAKY